MVGTWWTYGSGDIVAIVASRSRSWNSALTCASNVAARSVIAPPLVESALRVRVAQGGDGAQPEVDDAARLGEATALEPRANAAAGGGSRQREQRIPDGRHHVEDQAEHQRLQPDRSDGRVDELRQERDQEQRQLRIQRADDHAIEVEAPVRAFRQGARSGRVATAREGAN